MSGPDVADVVAAQEGDGGAFRRLAETMQGRIWRYVMMLMRDAALAEDITQEVLIRVYRKLPSLQSPDRFVPWVMTITRNMAFDAGRAKRRRPLVLVEDAAAIEGRHHDPHISLEIHDALDHLDSALKEALVLVGVLGLTYEEAADSLGVPEGTVKSRVFRARRQLHLMMDEEPDDE